MIDRVRPHHTVPAMEIKVCYLLQFLLINMHTTWPGLGLWKAPQRGSDAASSSTFLSVARGTLYPVAPGTSNTPAHSATNYAQSLKHCRSNPNPYRYGGEQIKKLLFWFKKILKHQYFLHNLVIITFVLDRPSSFISMMHGHSVYACLSQTGTWGLNCDNTMHRSDARSVCNKALVNIILY